MNTLDLAEIIDGLLSRPLLALHIDQLSSLRRKERNGGLNEVDKVYITDLWGKFRSLPAAGRMKEAPPQTTDEALGQRSSALEIELRKMNLTIEKLREALRLSISQKDSYTAQIRELSKQISVSKQHQIEIDRLKFEQTKRSFAKLYHPNSVDGHSEFDSVMRSRIFKEFWIELERIEAAE